MRWKTALPKYKDRRIVRRFAFRPTLLSDGETTVWLERFYVLQRYDINIRWIDVQFDQDWSRFDEGTWVLRAGKFHQIQLTVPVLRD